MSGDTEFMLCKTSSDSFSKSVRFIDHPNTTTCLIWVKVVLLPVITDLTSNIEDFPD